MVSLWCSKEEFMTASQLPCCSRDRSGYPCPSSMVRPLISRAFPIPSPTLGPKGYQGRSAWLVRIGLDRPVSRTLRRVELKIPEVHIPAEISGTKLGSRILYGRGHGKRRNKGDRKKAGDNTAC